MIKFNDERLTVHTVKYANGRPAIQLLDEQGFPYMIATVNVPNIILADDEVIIKDYSENKGIYDVLVKHKIISPAIAKIDVGYATSPICKILI